MRSGRRNMAPVRMWTVLFVIVFSSPVSSLFFHLRDTEQKCFLQDIADDMQLLGNFRARLYDTDQDFRNADQDFRNADQDFRNADQDFRINVIARDPDHELILSRTYSSEGSFRFTSKKRGEHTVCLQANSSQHLLPAGGTLALHLDIRVGAQANTYHETELTELQLRIQRLREQVEQIQKGQEYQRLGEKDFRQVHHNTNMWIFWWPVVRSLYVVFMIIWFTKSW